MKSLSAFCIALLSVLFLIGCSDDPVPSSNTIQQLFPMAVGNSWNFQNINYDDLGNIAEIDTMDMVIDSAGTSYGHSGFFASIAGMPSFLFYNNNDLRSRTAFDSDDQMIIRYPMAANEIVITQDTTDADGWRSQSLFKMISENTPVTVPGGTFNCVVYMDYNLYGKGTLDTSSYDILSFAFGTGYVKHDSYYRRNGSTSEMVHSNTTALIKATIK